MNKKKNKIANNIKNNINKALSKPTIIIDPAPSPILTLTKLLKKRKNKKTN